LIDTVPDLLGQFALRTKVEQPGSPEGLALKPVLLRETIGADWFAHAALPKSSARLGEGETATNDENAAEVLDATMLSRFSNIVV
jgi:hypothetical protein